MLDEAGKCGLLSDLKGASFYFKQGLREIHYYRRYSFMARMGAISVGKFSRGSVETCFMYWYCSHVRKVVVQIKFVRENSDLGAALPPPSPRPHLNNRDRVSYTKNNRIIEGIIKKTVVLAKNCSSSSTPLSGRKLDNSAYRRVGRKLGNFYSEFY